MSKESKTRQPQAEIEAESPTSSAPEGAEKTKEILGQVVNSAIFESGILEKVIDRRIEKRLAKALKGEISSLIDRQIQAALSSEDMKILLDDKFRAMSLYLKGEVIPKTVKKILKEEREAAGQPS